jgi:hypothetical protein
VRRCDNSRVTMKPFRLVAALSAAALVTAIPITAWGDGAGDAQYLEKAKELHRRIIASPAGFGCAIVGGQIAVPERGTTAPTAGHSRP